MKTLSLLFLATALSFAQSPGVLSPTLHGETASGKPIDLPGAGAGKMTLLIFGFSKAGGHQAGAWEQRASADFGQDAHFAVYSIAVLEGVPGPFRGMAKSGIRNGTPTAKRDRMVIAMSGRAEWEHFFHVGDDKVPYLVLLDPTGHVLWTGHGLFDEQQYKALAAAAREGRP